MNDLSSPSSNSLFLPCICLGHNHLHRWWQDTYLFLKLLLFFIQYHKIPMNLTFPNHHLITNTWVCDALLTSSGKRHPEPELPSEYSFLLIMKPTVNIIKVYLR